MEIQVEETSSMSDRCIDQPVRSRQLMKLAMEIGQRPSQTRNGPRAVAHHCDHVRPLDALDNHVTTSGGVFFDGRHGESLDSDIIHDPSLLYHRTSLARAPKH